MAERDRFLDNRDDRPGVVFRFRAPVAEPVSNSDFEVVWSPPSTDRQTSYSLVRVPIGAPVEIVYSKPTEELFFTMSPTDDPDTWAINGDIDSDIVQLLGMPVESVRDGGDAPTVGAANIEHMRRFGIVNTPDDQIIEVALTVPSKHITQLLDGLWRPIQDPRESHRMYFSLDNGNGFRVLPEKTPPSSKKDGATLKVRKPQPAQK